MTVPVPVLEALASAWEDQARQRDERTPYAPTGEPAEATTLAACARQLRDAITHGGAG